MSITSNPMAMVSLLADLEWGWLAIFAAAGIIAVLMGGIIMVTVWLTGGLRG